ncbi:hypothetical protein Hdeb2414_s0114g00799121 [Helianthus debilis subsp. tardiflorus]
MRIHICISCLGFHAFGMGFWSRIRDSTEGQKFPKRKSVIIKNGIDQIRAWINVEARTILTYYRSVFHWN